MHLESRFWLDKYIEKESLNMSGFEPENHVRPLTPREEECQKQRRDCVCFMLLA